MHLPVPNNLGLNSSWKVDICHLCSRGVSLVSHDRRGKVRDAFRCAKNVWKERRETLSSTAKYHYLFFSNTGHEDWQEVFQPVVLNPTDT